MLVTCPPCEPSWFPCSSALEEGRVWVSGGSPTQLTLTLSCSSGPLEMSLSELPAAEHSAELQTMLLSVWDRLVTTESRLAGTNCYIFIIESRLAGTNYYIFIIRVQTGWY